MKIQLELTKKQLDLLIDTLESYWDEGPHGEGWQSNELIELTRIVTDCVDKYENNKY